MNRADFLKAMVGAGLVPKALMGRVEQRAVQTPGAPDMPSVGSPFTVTIGGHEMRPHFIHVDVDQLDVTTALDTDLQRIPGPPRLDIEAPREEVEKLRGVYEDGEVVEMVARLDRSSAMISDVVVTGLDITPFPDPAHVYIEAVGPVTLS